MRTRSQTAHGKGLNFEVPAGVVQRFGEVGDPNLMGFGAAIFMLGLLTALVFRRANHGRSRVPKAQGENTKRCAERNSGRFFVLFF